MQPFDAMSRLEGASLLDPLVDRLKTVVNQVPLSRRARDGLHGVWLGHPLHPALVQVPIGTWLSAGVLDLVPGTGPAAPTLIVTGLLAAGPAAAAGWVDWSELHEQQMRVGLVHATSNVAAVGLYTASLIARARGRSTKGKLLGWAGLGATSIGGLLGGHLSYRQAAGANHTEHVPHAVAPGWQRVAELEELPQDKFVERQLGAVPLLLLRRGSAVSVLADHCSHLSGPLHEGELQDGIDPCVVCPWHGSVFRIRDGAVVHGPATARQPVFQTRVIDGQVEVLLEGAG
jgi:nitrite reductase/ring-hydroxylating ferredoxin subunit/uncharacterized membrane protein